MDKKLYNAIQNKNYTHFFCDFAKINEILKTLDKIKKKVKKIDVLVNNAGVTKENVNSIKKNKICI